MRDIRYSSESLKEREISDFESKVASLTSSDSDKEKD